MGVSGLGLLVVGKWLFADDLSEIDILHQVYAGVCHLFRPEEFAEGGAGTPDFNLD